MKVKSLLVNHSATVIDSSWTLAEVENFFRRIADNYLEIRSAQQFVGIIARGEFQKFLEYRDYSLKDKERTSVVAALPSVCGFCDPDESVDCAWNTMTTKGLTYLGVKSLDRVVGVVSYQSVASVITDL